MVSVQCLNNSETYTGALLKCSQLKTMSERNMCRAKVTERYRNLMDIPTDGTPYFKRVKRVTLEGYTLEDEDVH